jgi:hypothetical protein
MLGLLVALSALFLRSATQPKATPTAPYRSSADREDETSELQPPTLVVRAPLTIAAAVTLAMPLVASLVIR